MADQPTAEIERFRATNGRIVGGTGLALCGVIAALLVATETLAVAVPGVIGCAFVAGTRLDGHAATQRLGQRLGAAPADAVRDDHHPAGVHRHGAGPPLSPGALGW